MQLKKIVDMLTEESVSIITQKYMQYEGETVQVGEKHRKGYSNSAAGRTELAKTEPKEVVEAVMAIWGNPRTVTDWVQKNEE